MPDPAATYRVSVVLPTFDRAATIERSIRSVLAQTRAPLELIVVDDGSTDGTEQLVRRRFPEVRYLRQENRGVSAARNRGIAAARGNWIAFLDSDDEWLPRKLERQLAALEAAPEHRLIHTDEIWIRRGRRVNPMRKHEKSGGWIFERCLPLCAISPSSALLARAIFDEIGAFDEELPVCEDYDLWLRICSRHPVLYIGDHLIRKYGGHADQLSRRYWGMDRFRMRALEKLIDSGHLEGRQEEAALATLLSKIEIYLSGARKRGKAEEVAEYEGKRAFWTARRGARST